MAKDTQPVELTGSYLEYTVIAEDTIIAGATKYYTVDILTQFGALNRDLGIALGATNASPISITLSVFSIPKGISAVSDPNAFTQNENLFTASNIVINYPLQKTLGFKAPKIIISLTNNGAVDLTGVKIIVFGIKGV